MYKVLNKNNTSFCAAQYTINYEPNKWTRPTLANSKLFCLLNLVDVFKFIKSQYKTSVYKINTTHDLNKLLNNYYNIYECDVLNPTICREYTLPLNEYIEDYWAGLSTEVKEINDYDCRHVDALKLNDKLEFFVVYKVVMWNKLGNQYISFNNERQYNVEYKVNDVAFPHPDLKGSKLYCFDSETNASIFYNNFKHSVSMKIFKSIGVNVVEAAGIGTYSYSSLWENDEYDKPPRGSMWADAIYMMEEVLNL